MKRTLVLLLTALLVFSLCACGKSEKASAVEEQITALGKITLDSDSAITNAENAWNSLTQEDKSQVENYEALKEARSTYDHLVLQNAADQIDLEILKIEEMTSGKPDAVKNVKKLFEKAAPEIQALVKNRDMIDTYLENMDDLEAEEARILISDIGEITLESKDKIIAAKKAYYSLPAFSFRSMGRE